MEDPLINDRVIRLFLSRSSLTENQFLAYLVRKGKIDKEIFKKFTKRKKILRTRGAIAGSYLQAKNNIQKSLYTILLLFYLDVWKDKEKHVILSLIDGLKKIDDMDDDHKDDIVSYILKIIEVMT